MNAENHEDGIYKLERTWVEELIFGDERSRRYTQDSPVLPDVWLGFAENLLGKHDLLITPHREVKPGELSKLLQKRLRTERKSDRWGLFHPAIERPPTPLIAYNQSVVVAELWFDELVRVILPLSNWWEKYISGPVEEDVATFLRKKSDEGKLTRFLAEFTSIPPSYEIRPELIWMVRVIGYLEAARLKFLKRSKQEKITQNIRKEIWDGLKSDPQFVVDSMASLLEGLVKSQIEKSLVWGVNRNRRVLPSITHSVPAIKADAATRLFNLSCQSITWAVIDSGIDARHPAFRKKDMNGRPYPEPFLLKGKRWINQTRIKAAYDFTLVRKLLSADLSLRDELPPELMEKLRIETKIRKELRDDLSHGKEIDWDLILPYIEVPLDGDYQFSGHEHGTHVAGIIAADWPMGFDGNSFGRDITGVCPDINLYDLRVLGSDGSGDEFSVMTALQFIRYLNAHKDYMELHGANLSLAIRHDVANFACGRTPVCEECSRLIGAGILVVVAAGNLGYLQYITAKGLEEGYHSISITDPGNTEEVITVGSTHRYRPHTYGVSYFSSRGPTGDGRMKPDLVAPGEKVEAPVPGKDLKRMDGTSMAAPHVSGAAALLMSRHRELIGQPLRIKHILCSTATDLGRERYFQGCGLVDILRALQSV